MPRLLRKAAHGVLHEVLSGEGDWVNQKQKMNRTLAESHGLHSDTYRMMMHALLVAVVDSGCGSSVGSHLPSLANWQLP